MRLPGFSSRVVIASSRPSPGLTDSGKQMDGRLSDTPVTLYRYQSDRRATAVKQLLRFDRGRRGAGAAGSLRLCWAAIAYARNTQQPIK